MTYPEVQKNIKIATDKLLLGYKGKIEIGGTLMYRFPADEYIDKVVQQTVFNSGNYPVCVCFAVSHNLINLHYATALKAHKNYLKTMVTLIVYSPAAAFDFIIKKAVDIDLWIEQLKKYLAIGLPMLEDHCSIDTIEKGLNKVLDEREIEQFTEIDERTFHLGLIAARLQSEAFYKQKFAKVETIYKNLQHNLEQLYALHNYLTSLKPEHLNNLKYLKSQLK